MALSVVAGRGHCCCCCYNCCCCCWQWLGCWLWWCCCCLDSLFLEPAACWHSPVGGQCWRCPVLLLLQMLLLLLLLQLLLPPWAHRSRRCITANAPQLFRDMRAVAAAVVAAAALSIIHVPSSSRVDECGSEDTNHCQADEARHPHLVRDDLWTPERATCLC